MVIILAERVVFMMIKNNFIYMKNFTRFFWTLIIFFSCTLPVWAADDKGVLINPLGDADEPNEVIANVIKTSLGVLGGLTLLVFVYGGFLWLTSIGNSEKVKKGQDTLMWAVIGLVVIFGAYGLADALFKAFGQ